MPQLMPLPWLISFIMGTLFVVSMSVIYSNLMLKNKINVFSKSYLFGWFW